MRAGLLKTLIIVGFILLAGWILYPTYQWYYVFSEEEKALTSIPKKDINTITDSIETNVAGIRSAIKNNDWFFIASDKEGAHAILDIRTNATSYVLKISQEDLKKIVLRENPEFKDFDGLDKKYTETKSLMARLDKINHYKLLKKRVLKLGLDLAGGAHFVLGIDEQKMIEGIQQIYKGMMNEGKIKEQLKKEHPEYNEAVLAEKVKERLKELQKKMEDAIENEKKEGIDRALIKISSRVDQFGVAEPVIRRGAQNTIVVELPGEKDKEAAKEIITKVGHLTLKLVNDEVLKNVPVDKKNHQGYVIDRDYINELKRTNNLPEDTEFYWVQEMDKFGMPKFVGALPLFKKVELDGDKITDAHPAFEQTGEPYISFELNSDGADIFAKVTKANIHKRLAIVMDDRIQSAPTIQGEIPTGKAQITGSFTVEEAKTLSSILRSGSLPIPLKIEEEKVVGPSLGLDQIDKGQKSALYALILVSLFMIVYYKWSGINANFAQIINLIFTFALLAQLGGTLTLPGIVGIVLTIGMNVDANILINERIKEELRAGRSVESSILHGYQRAFSAIFDGHLTAIMVAVVLAVIGNGPIKGFGVTLIIGLLCNLFTAVFITHFIYDVFSHKFRIKKISI